MLRLREHNLLTIRCVPTGEVVDSTGGVSRLPFFNSFTFLGLLLPPKRRLARTVSGVRLAVSWTLIPQSPQNIKEQDLLYLQGDPRAYVLSAIKRYPRHCEYNIELMQ